MNVTCKSDKVKISDEHDDYGWFSFDELNKMKDDGILTPHTVTAFNLV